HSLCFLQLSYQKEADAKAVLVEFRQFSESVVAFEGFELEEGFVS
ncbi:MAG: Unknown protein, partial [uncultured Sulfurovum sp.]